MNEKIILLIDISIGHLQSLLHGEFKSEREVIDHIEDLKAANKKLERGTNSPIARPECEEHNVHVSERDELREEMCHLTHALHDMQVELVRTTGELRSLSLVLSKIDLGTENKIIMKISELSGVAADIKTSALKGFSEVRKRIDELDLKIVDLVKQLADADIPPAAEADLKDAQTLLKQLDEIVPDAPELPPPTTP